MKRLFSRARTLEKQCGERNIFRKHFFRIGRNTIAADSTSSDARRAEVNPDSVGGFFLGDFPQFLETHWTCIKKGGAPCPCPRGLVQFQTQVET